MSLAGMHGAAAVRAGLLARVVRRPPGLGRQLSQNVAAVLQSSSVTTWGGRSDARTQAARLTPVAAAVLETSGKAAATIEASSGPPALHASGAPRAKGAAQSSASGAPQSTAQKVLGAPATPLTRSAATPLTRSVAYAWLKERKAKQEAAIIEATVLLQGDVTGDAAAASLNAAMMSCGDIGRWAQALALYERMAAGGVRVEQRSFRLAMTSAMQLGRYETALHIWHRLLAAGLRPQREEYTVSMSACERLGEWEEALGLFDEMAAQGVKPDTNTLHVAILACERGGQASRADGLLRRMEAFGRPPTALYNAAMRACARHGNAHAGALDALTRMRRLGVPRDAATYRAALAACQAGGAAARSELLSVIDWLLQEPEAVVRACTGDAPLCTSALEACAASGHWRAALALLRHARPAAASARPGAFLPVGTSFCGVPAGTAICGRGEQERSGAATAATAPVATARPPTDGAAAAAWAVETRQWHELALRACAARGQWSHAMKLLESLRELEVPLSAACYTHAISACSNGAQWHEVLVLYAELRGHAGGDMSAAGVAELRGVGEEPHNAAILALGRVKRGADALALFEELPSLHPPSLHPPSPAASAAHGGDMAAAPEAAVPHHWSWTPAQEAEAPEVAAAQAAAAAAAHEAEAARFGRSTASFNSALIACVECGQLEQVRSLVITLACMCHRVPSP